MCISISGTEQISVIELFRNWGFVGVTNKVACGFLRAALLVRRSIALRIAGGRGAGDDTFCALMELSTLAASKEILNTRPMQ